jgi:hypothetical protein
MTYFKWVFIVKEDRLLDGDEKLISDSEFWTNMSLDLNYSFVAHLKVYSQLFNLLEGTFEKAKLKCPKCFSILSLLHFLSCQIIEWLEINIRKYKMQYKLKKIM